MCPIFYLPIAMPLILNLTRTKNRQIGIMHLNVYAQKLKLVKTKDQ